MKLHTLLSAMSGLFVRANRYEQRPSRPKADPLKEALARFGTKRPDGTIYLSPFDQEKVKDFLAWYKNDKTGRFGKGRRRCVYGR